MMPADRGDPCAMSEPAVDRKIEGTTSRTRAIALMVLAVSLFACLDTTAKYLISATRLPAAQVVWMRFLGQFVVILLVLGAVSVPRLLQTQKRGLQIVRSVFLLCSTVFNFLALKHLRLDQALTIQFLAPLLVALLAGPFLGEWIGWRRLLAIFVGFAGILVMIRPGLVEIHPAVVYAFGSMLSYVAFILLTRHLTAYDPAENTLFYSLLAGTFFVAPLAVLDWAWPENPGIWLLLLSLGFWGGAGHYVFILAHRAAPAATVAPFIYVQLLAVTGLGFLVFGDLPDLWTLVGALIVATSGIYLVHRERVRRRQ